MFGLNKKSNDKVWQVPDDAPEPVTETRYDQALSFLVGLSDKEFKQTIDVAKAHRKANEESAKILNVVYEPTAMIFDPADGLQVIRPVHIKVTETEPQEINVKTKKAKAKK